MTNRVSKFLALAAAIASAHALQPFEPSPETLPGPSSPADQPAWLANITAWAAATRAAVNYTPAVYDQYLHWTENAYISPQAHLFDAFLWDDEARMWTVDRFLDDLQARYGGIDAVLLWASYPNLGTDARSQFDLMLDLPGAGGIAGLQELARQFHARGVKLLAPYNPWDTGTIPNNASDAQRMAELLAAAGWDGFNGDTMWVIPEAFFAASVAAGNPLALQPELGPSFFGLAWSKMGWGYWDIPYIPVVDSYKWLEPRHKTQVCDRWAPVHTDQLQAAFFNGNGFVSWESIWGIWNEMSRRDSEATRRVGALSRYFSPFLSSSGWVPHDILDSGAAAAGVFCSRWPAPAGSIYAHNATYWTLVHRGGANYSGPVVPAPCPGSGSANTVYFDAYHGTSVTPQQQPSGGCAISLQLEVGGYGAVLQMDAGDVTPDLQAFLSSMATMTATALASYSTANPYLPQTMMDYGRTTPPAVSPPAGMTLIPSQTWTFAVSGTEIEPFSGDCITSKCLTVDVQFPWETIAQRVHNPVQLTITSFWIDTTPVTNAAYAQFMADSGYWPADAHNYLRDWSCSGPPPATCAYPQGWDRKPVTWVDVTDARAFCNYYGKRLPNDYEWQLAAVGNASSYTYPWGTAWDATRVPTPNLGRTLLPPDDVDAHPTGASPYGVLDLMGNVWQFTNQFADAHTRAVLLRGGSSYIPQGSGWYAPNVPPSQRPISALTHNKWLMLSPGYNRAGTVGFRCVADAE